MEIEFLEQIVFNTTYKVKEHIVIIMIESTHEGNF